MPSFLKFHLGRRDQRRLDEFLDSVREIEGRIERAEEFKDVPNDAVESPTSIPASLKEHIDFMYGMMVLSFQTDSTESAHSY